MELMELLEMENLDKRWPKWKSNRTYWFGIYTVSGREDWLVNVKMRNFGRKAIPLVLKAKRTLKL